MATPTVQIDDLRQAHWTEAEARNAETVADFIQTLMNEHDFDRVKEKHPHPGYVQHNRAIPDGIPGLIGYVEQLVKRFPGYSYEVLQIVSSGDQVVFHSHATLSAKHRGDQSKGFIIFDMWKVVDGQILDHWDALQPLDLSMRFFNAFTGGRIANQNGLL